MTHSKLNAVADEVFWSLNIIRLSTSQLSGVAPIATQLSVCWSALFTQLDAAIKDRYGYGHY